MKKMNSVQMFCEQNKSAQNGVAYKASNENGLDTWNQRKVEKEREVMSHFACSRIRKLDKILWTSTSHMECSTGANMQADTQQSQLASSGSTDEKHPPFPPHLLHGANGGTYHLLALLRRYISGEKRRKRKQGISNNTVWIITGSFYFVL